MVNMEEFLEKIGIELSPYQKEFIERIAKDREVFVTQPRMNKVDLSVLYFVSSKP